MLNENFNYKKWFEASESGDLPTVKEYLKTNIDVNITMTGGITALMLASNHGHIEVVKELLKRPDIDVNLKDTKEREGLTALISATGSPHIVKELLTHPDIDVNIRANTNNRETALLDACQWGHLDTVKLLLDFPKTDIKIKDDFDNTPLIKACLHGHNNVVKVLLKYPEINVNDYNLSHMTALMFASKHDYSNIAYLLLLHNADYNIKNIDGKTAIDMAYTTSMKSLILNWGNEDEI